ncbi:hypothetical protein [Pontibacter litorisediminis]|uniref:hypothetical protein n=1 Tax=Pontibacter litorisediminis TaxID=1846260 RepID=UPI0023EAB5B7|nr:hypothetical protein [Pontibacter litorisediminis]
MKKKLLSLLALSLLSAPAFAQTISRLDVGPGETYVVAPENVLQVDTLVLHEKATIRFSPTQQGVLHAKVAYIGKKCTISARGLDGANGSANNPGQNGEAGGNLSLQLHLEQLGSLTIDASGGRGGKGANGKNGRQGKPDEYVTKVSRDAHGKTVKTVELVPGTLGTNGTDATMGGNGGDGGNIMLVYSTKGFIANFNRDIHVNNINILYNAGESGKSGTPGKGGFMSSDGMVIASEYRSGRDGKVQLMNLNQPQP